jgi:signal transduction histidine kinase
MSRKALRNLSPERIDSLFSDLDLDAPEVIPAAAAIQAGWTWECDDSWLYTMISPEVENILGIMPEAFINQSITDYRLHPLSISVLIEALEQGEFPLNVKLNILNLNEEPVLVGMSITSRGNFTNGNHKPAGLRGFAHVLSEPDNTLASTEEPGAKSKPIAKRNQSGNGKKVLTKKTRASINSLIKNPPSQGLLIQDSNNGQPARLVIPASAGEAGSDFFLELIDAETPRVWSDDDRLLVEQVAGQLSMALENAHLIAKTNQALSDSEARAKELGILNEMSRAFASNLQVDSIVKYAYQYTSELMDTGNFFVGLTHADDQSITFHHVMADGILVEESHPEWSYWSQRQPISGLSAYVINNRTPLLIEKNALSYLEENKLPFIEVGTGGVESWLGVPMSVGEQVLGVIAVQSETTPNLYNQKHLEILTTIGNQSAIAIQNARLLEETRRKNNELAAINTIISAASRTLDMTTMLEAVLTQMLFSSGYQAGLVSIFNPISKSLYLAAQQEMPTALVEAMVRTSLVGTLSEHVYNRGELICIENFQLETRGDYTNLINHDLQSYLGVPLESKGKILGTLCLYGKNPLPLQPGNLALVKSIGQQVGVAVDNARLFEQTQKALAETEILYNASARLNSAQNYQEILSALSLYSVLGAADINITLDLFDRAWKPNHLPDTINVVARKARGKQQELPHYYRLSTLPSLQDILRQDRIAIIHDSDLDPRLDESLKRLLVEGFHAKCAIFVPLVVSGHWIGYVNGLFSETIDYEEREFRRLLALSNLAAVAIQNIRLLEDSRRRADQLQTAAVIAKDTSSTLALDTLLDRAVNLIRDGFSYSHASLFLLNESGRLAQIRASTGEAGREMIKLGHILPVGSKSIIGHVTQSGRPYIVNNVLEDPFHLPNPLLPGTKSEAGIPLQIGNRVIGALDVQSNQLEAFNQEDISVLQVLADQIAVAVDNARAYELSVQAVEEMRNADQVKSQFLANMSHELRTPLNSIIGFSRVILKGIDGPVTDLQQQDLSAIYTSGQHLLNLINDILDLSKIEAGKMELSFEEGVNLPDLINSVMSTVAGLVKDKPIQLQRSIAPDLPPLRVDATKVRQILLNLFSNAAKFTDEGSITIDAQLQIHDGIREVQVSVTDTGTGISLEDQGKLFQPFTQVDPSPTRKTGGSGLGLSICRHLVEMHGGQIGLFSEPGKGSTFYFTLPAPLPKPKQTGEYTTGFLGPVILAIEDDAQVIGLYQRYLGNRGYKIFPLTDASLAAEVAGKLQPVAITLDIMMPERNGWDVLQELKSNPSTANIPVIICTLLEEQAKGINLGASDYLMKPVLEDDLLNAIERLGKKKASPS